MIFLKNDYDMEQINKEKIDDVISDMIFDDDYDGKYSVNAVLCA